MFRSSSVCPSHFLHFTITLFKSPVPSLLAPHRTWKKSKVVTRKDTGLRGVPTVRIEAFIKSYPITDIDLRRSMYSPIEPIALQQLHR